MAELTKERALALARARRRRAEATVNPLVAAPVAAAQGINTGLANALGLPVDLVNAALQQVGMGSEAPFGGSASIRGGLESLGATYSDISDVPEQYRPVAKGGEVVGESVPFAAAPLVAAGRLAAGQAAKGVTAPFVEAARSSPAAFTAIEGAGAIGAGAGRAGAEAVDPGNELLGTGAEIVGGVVGGLSPTALVVRASRGALGSVGRVRAMLSRSGREQAAAKVVRGAMEDAGEDVGRVATALDAPDAIPGTRLTAGQKSGSPTLLAIERSLANRMPDLDNATRTMLRDTSRAIDQAYREAVESGDPAALQEIARTRQQWFRSMLETKVASASERATKARGKIAPDTPDARAQANLNVRKTVEDALSDARQAETALWSQIDRTQPMRDLAPLSDALEQATDELLPGEALPSAIDRAAKAVLNQKDVTAGDILRVRSRALAMMRNIRGSQAPDWDMHRRLGIVADGALEALSEVEGVDAARDYSRALNDVFTRGPTGQVLGFERTGGSTIAPELTLERTVAGGGPKAAVASAALEEAAQYTGRTTVADQEQFLKDMLVKTVDPATGEVRPDQLARFAEQNKELLARFPELRGAVTDAEQAQRFLENAVRTRNTASKVAEQKAAFSRVTKFEDPKSAIRDALRSNAPLRNYQGIARLARRGGDEALAGLRASTFDYLFDQANKGGFISGAAMREALTRRATPNSPNLLETMSRSGVLNDRQRNSLLRVITEAERMEGILATGQRIDDVIGDVNALADLVTRIVGANIGGASVLGRMSGSSIVTAHAGSRFARTIADKIPATKTREVLAEAIQSPQLMSLLLRKAGTPRSRRILQRQINAYLIQAGILSDEDRNSEER